MAMAKIIEFYVPGNFQKKVAAQSSARKGKVLEFSGGGKRSA
jgi:hypothetical protein